MDAKRSGFADARPSRASMFRGQRIGFAHRTPSGNGGEITVPLVGLDQTTSTRRRRSGSTRATAVPTVTPR